MTRAGVIGTRTLDTTSDGGIVLPQILQRLKARGFRFVTVDQLLRPGG